MIGRFLTILLILFFGTVNAQMTFELDYLLEYESFEIGKEETKLKESFFIATNSKNNNYYLEVKNLDTLKFKLNFMAHDSMRFNFVLRKNDFFNSDSIEIVLPDKAKFSNTVKFRIQNHDFINLRDTIIQESPYKQYIFKNIDPKKAKKAKSYTYKYIIERGTEFHLPVLVHPTAYEDWKVNRNIPNGIFREKLFYDYYGILDTKYKLKKIHKIKKLIYVLDQTILDD